MKNLFLLTLPIALSNLVFAQTLTFNGTGAATTIEKVIAFNLTTCDTVSVTGNTITIKNVTGISDIEYTGIRKVYPNPFTDNTLLEYVAGQKENVSLIITNSTGQLIANMDKCLTPGVHYFEFRPAKAGIYFLSIKTNSKTYSQTLMSTFVEGKGNILVYRDFKSIARKGSDTLAGNELPYIPGDKIKFECFSGVYGTVFVDAPTQDKTYTVTFITCMDADSLHHYKTIKIGSQTWMAENVNTGKMVQLIGHTNLHTDNGEVEKFCYNNDRDMCTLYGGLYMWGEAMQYAAADNGTIGKTQGICPPGWHIPTSYEWGVLANYLGGASIAGGKLKTTCTTDDGKGLWYPPNTEATNSSGFSAIPGGWECYHCGGVFDGVNADATFWGAASGIGHYLYCNYAELKNNSVQNEDGYSIRCIKN